ncbi:MAG TPA: response regulator transcription factor [Bacteroidota bacterium]|nr:response regulator transcription factor [Bacteroidota bacterium]
MIKIVIADDHPIVRHGMVELLAEESDLKVVGQAGTFGEIVDNLQRRSVDIIVLDLNMPGKHGLDAVKHIAAHFKRTKILVVSAYPEEQFAKRVLKDGASGFLSKDAAPSQLVNAIRKISLGGKYISPTAAEKIALESTGSFEERLHERLSDREFQVFLMIAGGKSVSEIGNALFLSPKTISTYRSRILSKLQLSSNADLTRYALEHKLIN